MKSDNLNKHFPLSRYELKGLHYYQSFDFNFSYKIILIVGQSGMGKTSILFLMYLTLKKYWLILARQSFDFISLEFESGVRIEFSRTELELYLLRNSRDIDIQVYSTHVAGKFSEIEYVIMKNMPGDVLYFPVFRDMKDDLLRLGKDIARLGFSEDYQSEELAESMQLEGDILIPQTLNELVAGTTDNALLRLYVSICNKYLDVVKVVHDPIHETIYLHNQKANERVDLSQVSSGERQLLYMFGKVIFAKSQSVYVLLDEPELSISIEWQRRLLIELLTCSSVSQLIAITHSPFIFDNELDQFAESISSYIKL